MHKSDYEQIARAFVTSTSKNDFLEELIKLFKADNGNFNETKFRTCLYKIKAYNKMEEIIISKSKVDSVLIQTRFTSRGTWINPKTQTEYSF